MYNELNRLTLNFANLFQDRGTRMSEKRNLPWMILNSAMINYSTRQISGITLTPRLPVYLPSSAPFLQFGKEIFNQQYLITQLPSIVPLIERSKEGDSWSDRWMGLDGVFNRFSQRLRQFSAKLGSQRARATSSSGIWLTPNVTRQTITDITTKHQSSIWNSVQQSTARSFLGNILQGQRAWASPSGSWLTPNVTQQTITDITTKHRLSIWDSVPQSFKENISQGQLAYRGHAALDSSRSLTEAFSYQTTVVSKMMSVFQDISMVIPKVSVLPIQSPSLSLSPFFRTEFYASVAEQTPIPEKTFANSVLEVRNRMPIEPSVVPSSFTFNGGIHVQITTQSIDPNHADETARLIASQVVKEISRLTDQSRFRRGLSTANNF